VTRLPATFSGRPPGAGAGILLAALGLLFAGRLPAAETVPAPPAIAQELRSFREFGSVLYVAAHPDDENTQLITYLARGRDYRTAYLSLTRGDGGQNLLGSEFGDLLGVIRTQELLAARAVDGGRQYFSRARDFGYSKDYRQTLTKWDHQQVLADLVRVIRTFRPDILVTRFPPEPGPTHGHHTASAALALEAFRLAGDPHAFPEQLPALAPWQPRRILWNGYGQGGDAPAAGVLHLAIDGDDPVTGAPFAVLAAKSRSMHRTQGFANFTVASGGSGPRIESFEVLAGEPATQDIMEGVDTTWGRVPGGAAVGPLADAVLAHFNPADPAASVPALLELKARVAALAPDPVVDEKRLLLDRILQDALGLTVTALAGAPEVTPGESLALTDAVHLTSAVPVTWQSTRLPGRRPDRPDAGPLGPAGATAALRWTVPPAAVPTQPYWLRADETPGMFRVADAALIGQPGNPPTIPVEDTFIVGGQPLVVRHEVLFRDPDRAGLLRRPEVVAPVSLAFGSAVQLFAPGSAHEVDVTVRAARADAEGTLRLAAPKGWSVSPRAQGFHLAAAGASQVLAFTVTAPAVPETAEISARAMVGGTEFGTGRVAINYPHIPPILLQPPARLRAVSLELAIRGRAVGYLPGAGDSTAASLRQMGYAVTTLTGDDLTAERLAGFDAVVIGVRAFNTRTDLAPRLPALFAWVQAGGTVVEQYNTPGGLLTPQLAPYPLKLARDLPRYRVTDENSAVTLLQPDHPAFHVPNQIGAGDFTGWVQERGLDFASEFDAAHLVPLLACSDVGEAPLTGGLLVAHYGRGYFVYTGLSFFRQLPAGVPGAYRLFANLVSLGK
jgi:LmbE family N-acetylglucosaminyl deacetylase